MDPFDIGEQSARTFKSLMEQRAFVEDEIRRRNRVFELQQHEEAAKNYEYQAGAGVPAARFASTKPKWSVGDSILGQHRNGNTYPAIIASIHENGLKYKVSWNDGDSNNRELSADEIFPLVRRGPKVQTGTETKDEPLINDIRRKSKRLKSSGNTPDEIVGHQLYILVHSIDGVGLRSRAAQETLCFLASLPGVHVAATVDNIHAPLLWDSTQQCNYARFNWVWCHASTFVRYEFESLHLFGDNSSSAGADGRVRGASVVLASLPVNTRSVFQLLAQRHIDATDEKFPGLAFHEFYRECRSHYLTSSEDGFRALLRELEDHKIVVQIKSRGIDTLRINFDVPQIQLVLRNMSGDADDDGDAYHRNQEPATNTATIASFSKETSDSVSEECHILRPDTMANIMCKDQRKLDALERCAQQTKSTIEEAIRQGNIDLFQSIATFIGSASQNVDMGMFHRKLPAALLLTGINVADHAATFGQLSLQLRSQFSTSVPKHQSTTIAIASVSSACADTLEHILHTIISNLIRDSSAADAPKSSVSSMLFLERWYAGLSDETKPSKLVVMIHDVESIQAEILQDLMLLLSQSVRQHTGTKMEPLATLPICLVLGFATSTDALSRVLSHRERALLITRNFILQPARRTLNAFLDCLLDRRRLSPSAKPVAVSLPQLSVTALGQLTDGFFYCNFTLEAVAQNIAFAHAHHFFKQPLAFLCTFVGGHCPVVDLPRLDDERLAVVRQLPSVRHWVSSQNDIELDDRAMRDNIRKWLIKLRQHYCRLPAALRVLSEVLVSCGVLAQNRRDLRYTQDCLLNIEQQEREADINRVENAVMSMQT